MAADPARKPGHESSVLGGGNSAGLVLPLSQVGCGMLRLVGGKAANLGWTGSGRAAGA